MCVCVCVCVLLCVMCCWGVFINFYNIYSWDFVLINVSVSVLVCVCVWMVKQKNLPSLH